MWLLDDNARSHRHVTVRTWLDTNNSEWWIQPLYSLDLSVHDYGCFHQLKQAIGGIPYADATVLCAALDTAIQDGNQNHRYLAVRVQLKLWQCCLDVNRQCLEV